MIHRYIWGFTGGRHACSEHCTCMDWAYATPIALRIMLRVLHVAILVEFSDNVSLFVVICIIYCDIMAKHKKRYKREYLTTHL